jgi:glycerol-3-phosphate O-acyltransferase
MSDRSNVDEIIDYALQSFKEDKIVKELELDQNDKSADPDLYIINEEDRARINFYKNSIIHFTLPAGFCASIINRYADSGPIPMSLITEKFAELKELFSDEFVYMDHMNDVPATVMKTIEFLASSGIVTRENDSVVCIADRKNEIIFLSKMIQDIMESYLIVFSTAEHMSRTVSLKDLISDIRKKGIKMYHLGESTLSEALSMPSYNCAVSYLTRTSILLEKPGNKRDPDLKMINLQKLKEVNEELKAYLVKMIYFIR